jgi:uncharacterized integral membrane protein (TIGR00698 family)
MANATVLTGWSLRGRALLPGVLASAVVATAAAFLAQHYGAPAMMFALLLGMGMNFLAEQPCAPGIEFTARHVSRVGIALLGLRITAGQFTELGWAPMLVVVVAMVATIAVSMVAARALGFSKPFGLLSGGATAICGGTAALALAAALPAHPLKERALLFTIVGVAMLSTLTMIAYPMLASALALDARTAGVFIGATIHDIPQTVAAAYGMSKPTGDIATITKMSRVAMLVPVIILFTVMLMRPRGTSPAAPRPPLLPWFVVAFAALVLINSSGWLMPVVVKSGGDLSDWCLMAAIAAIGMKTRPRELAEVGLKPVVLMVGEAVFLATVVLVMLRWQGSIP